jgi:spermidine synthase
VHRVFTTAPPRETGVGLLAVSATAGAGTMIVELSAVRLLAPWFGTSLTVWTNVIGVILLALALGYWVGARVAEGPRPLVALSWALLFAGCTTTWLPSAGDALARALLPPEIALHEAAGIVGWGSLAVSSAVFLPPAALLGTVSPLVVEALARSRGLSPGRSGGLVLFVSTIGSLAGVFGTSHWLLPELGLRATFYLAGGVLLLAGALSRNLAREGSKRVPALGLLALAGVAALVPEQTALGWGGRTILARSESAYQSLRVVEDPVSRIRWLQVNEGLDSYQSVWAPNPGLLPEGYYYNDFLLPLSWSSPDRPWRVLVLGLGAGTVVRVFEAEAGVPAQFVGVEIDPEAVRLGELHFGLRTEREDLQVLTGLDARVALRATGGGFDQIILDCYSNQVEIPAHLCTLEFFEEAHSRLSEGGWLTANLGGYHFDDPVVAAVADTCALAFGREVMLVRVPHARNFILLARRSGGLPTSAGTLAAAHRPSALVLGARLLPGFSRVVTPGRAGGGLLTDDRCPIELLQAESLEEARSRGHEES